MREVIKEIEEAFFDIPFENSAFQNAAFVVSAEITPGRAFRAVGLRITAKLRALNETYFRLKRLEIDIEEINDKLRNENLSSFERRRLQVDLEEKQSNDWMTRKLIRDAEIEVGTLYALFKELPKYTRESFEAEEFNHFKERLLRQLGSGGAQVSLTNMLHDLPSLTSGMFGTTNLVATNQLENAEKGDGNAVLQHR